MLKSVSLMICMLAIGAVLATLGLRLLDQQSAPDIVIDDPREKGEMVVSVGGAVATPGVYTLEGDARYQNAIEAAGGTTEDADLASINMAQRVYDEQQIVVPSRNAPSQAQGILAPTAPPGATSVAAASGLININTATALELDQLDGIGEVLAAKIIAYREEHGPFMQVEELAQVDGISIGMVDDLRPFITV